LGARPENVPRAAQGVLAIWGVTEISIGPASRNDDQGTPAMDQFSDFIIYVDESGDHSLSTVNKEFPLFVLTFCIFKKEDYIQHVVPAFQALKFKTFGHDMVVLHEREIRKAEGPFAFLTDAARRNAFMADVNAFVVGSPFQIVAVVLRKDQMSKEAPPPENLYHLALRLALESLDGIICASGQREATTHIVFEARGRKEDDELELEFRRICDGVNHRKERLNLRIVIADKQINSTGLQLADLTARPIGRFVLNPAQSNRAYEIIREKLAKPSDSEIVEGFGLKCYP
jgi:hypothetical protein